MKTYFLPEELRPALRKIWGKPIFGEKSEVKKKFQQILKEKRFKKVITVGDYCSFNLPSDVKIFDGRIGRNKLSSLPRNPAFFKKGRDLQIWNPPASINGAVWEGLKKALTENKNVFVNGEEDLLVIPAVLLAEIGTAVIYGFTSKGICLIKASPKTKRRVRKLLEKFRTEKFRKIVLGGTFNKLHSGHRYFLSSAGYYAKKALIGLCSDQMVKTRKRHRRNVQPFKKRRGALESYLKKIKLKAEIVEINDIYGPAAEDKEAEAILLTEETYPNGRKINNLRKKNKLKELRCIIVPYLLDKRGKKSQSKLQTANTRCWLSNFPQNMDCD